MDFFCSDDCSEDMVLMHVLVILYRFVVFERNLLGTFKLFLVVPSSTMADNVRWCFLCILLSIICISVNASPWWQVRKYDFSTSMASTFILHLNLLNGSIESVVYIKCLP